MNGKNKALDYQHFRLAFSAAASIAGIPEEILQAPWSPSYIRSRYCYISGPISGCQDGNRAAFTEAAAGLKFDGLIPVNPHEVSENLPDTCPGWETLSEDGRWREYMVHDLAAMLTCGSVLILPGWRRSAGARVEYRLARGLGLRVMFQRPSLRDRIADLYWRTKCV